MSNLKNSLPKISIVIPSFNKAYYIRETLQSIVDQHYSNLEVIIQDGGSTDGSLEIIKSFHHDYPNLFRWVSKKDKGQVDAINKGLSKASGDIVTYLNADDVYKNGALLKIGSTYLKNSDVLWIAGFGDIINASGMELSRWVSNYKNFLLQLNRYRNLLTVNYIHQPATFLTREAYKQYGPFKGTRKYVMEYDLWLKLGKIKMPLIIKKELASFRLTTNNISSTSFNELLDIDYRIAKNGTNNLIILALHKLHNLSRKGLICFYIFYEKTILGK